MISDWRDQAACQGFPTEMFFPCRGDHEGVKRALAVCAVCPVRQQCTQFAMNLDIRYGIFGCPARKRRLSLGDTVTLTCARCDDPFEHTIAGSGRPKYCGDECRNEARTETQARYDRFHFTQQKAAS